MLSEKAKKKAVGAGGCPRLETDMIPSINPWADSSPKIHVKESPGSIVVSVVHVTSLFHFLELLIETISFVNKKVLIYQVDSLCIK
jgi:hypothetical protein